MDAALRVVPPAQQGEAGPEVELFGSFLLESDEFALPALCIREVVNLPERITVVPLGPPYLEGMFTLRGSVIPVVNLGRLFKPAAQAAKPGDKVAIIDHMDVQVGLLIHATGEILRVRPEQRSHLHYAQGEARGVVSGTILLEEGRRLLQVLDIDRLVQIENVPHVQSLRSAGAETRRHLRVVGERRHAIGFRAAGALFAIEMHAVQEIVRVPELHPSVLDTGLCIGHMHFRSQQVPVVDFAALAGGAASAMREEQRILVAHIGAVTVGFLVDSVESIVHYTSDEVMAIPLLNKKRSAMFAGCLARESLEDVILLDHNGILSSSDIAEIDQGHRNLYPADAVTPGGKGQQHGQRKSYLTFRVGELFALELKQVREIIDMAGDISHPPGMPEHLCGLLNLRQQLITLVDLRSFYGMEPASAGVPKVLVIDHGEGHYGLMVDSVCDIVMLDDAKHYGTPSLMKKPNSHGLECESCEVLELPDGHSVCLLDLGRMVEHLTALP
jgi:purine-binding chemotaxis protein CheW